MSNTITKAKYPDIWADLREFQKEETYHEHRRNSNYYTAWLLEFNEENCPEHPEIHGFWDTDTFIADHEYGIDRDDLPHTAFRVERKVKMVEKVYWERVKDDQVAVVSGLEAADHAPDGAEGR